jgi:glucose/arabinose dehydrogenase
VLLGTLGLVCPLWAAPQIDLQPVVGGLANPVAITHAGDGSGRLFITLQAGRIVIFDGSQILPTPFLDLSSLVSRGGEQGLLGVAFHPAYPSNGLFFVNYTNIDGNTVIARYSRSLDPNVADPNSAAILLTINQPFTNHNGGQLQFGPDGYLYIGMGDGGSAGDPLNNGQNLGTLLGKMLRIDVDSAFPYAIPRTNPFVGIAGALPEIWALGLRNPWRFSFDRSTGDLFIGDVGQNSWEEVDFQPADSPGGENYGWNRMEGNHCFPPSSNCNPVGLILPILEYDHSAGCSITGGYRYRGTQNPDLMGIYLYGDYCTGRIWGASEQAGGGWTTAELLDTSFAITTLGEDEAGELYVAQYSPSGGAIYRIVQMSNTGIPAVDIRANGSDAPITLLPQDTLSVTVAVDNNGRADNADWWLAANTPFGLYFYTFFGWTANLQPAYQGPLSSLNSFEVLTIPASTLPVGTYKFSFGVDTVMDGNLTAGNAYYDFVQVTVAP